MAPGYSIEIESPIDLGTIKVKIGQQINTSKCGKRDISVVQQKGEQASIHIDEKIK